MIGIRIIHFLIKKARGHKTDSVFQRFNLVTEDVVKDIKWLKGNRGKIRNDGKLYGHLIICLARVRSAQVVCVTPHLQ